MTSDAPPDPETIRAALVAPRMRDRIAAWKALPRCASAAPELVGELARGLADSHVLVRLAAARAVPDFAGRAGHLVPLLIRRRCDGDARVRHAAAVALAWVLPHVPPVPAWVSAMTHRKAHPGHNVFRLCRCRTLPETARTALHAAFERRRRWHLTHAGLPVGDEPFPNLWALARTAAGAAMRPGWPPRTNQMARLAEFAWQLAFAWELCHN